ncbi:MAG: 2-C-methyl-D-erythritol 4-phosphate cytidylyltransferase [Planctomycetota bacterium]
MIRCSVILPAAGRGSRFAAGRSGGPNLAASASKIELELEGRAVFLRSIDLFHGRPEVEQIVLAVDPMRYDEFMARWGETLAFMHVDAVPGGTAERWETVAEALKVVREDVKHIAVHDAARPATPKAMIDRVFAAAETEDAVIPGLTVADTLKRIDAAGQDQPAHPGTSDTAGSRADAILGMLDGDGGDGDAQVEAWKASAGAALGTVTQTVSRDGLVGVQTPQVFRAEPFRAAYAELASDPAAMVGVTDDASLFERRGVPVTVVAGDPGNLKLTRPEDAELLSALLRYCDAETKQADAVKDLFGDDDDD